MGGHMGELAGKVAIVTGAAGGMGLQIADRLAREGMRVVTCDISEQVHKAFSDSVAARGTEPGFSRVVDVTQRDQVDGLVREVTETIGPLFLAVCNAGALHQMCDVVDISDEAVDRVLAVNIRGTFNCARAAAQVMKARGAGQIVTVSSWYGRSGHPGFAVYCASKAAVISLTQSLALEMAPFGVRVNGVAPGNMATEMHWKAVREEAELRGISFEEMDKTIKASIPLGAQGTGYDLAGAIVWLAGSDGSYVTGQTINVNGGVWVD